MSKIALGKKKLKGIEVTYVEPVDDVMPTDTDSKEQLEMDCE